MQGEQQLGRSISSSSLIRRDEGGRDKIGQNPRTLQGERIQWGRICPSSTYNEDRASEASSIR